MKPNTLKQNVKADFIDFLLCFSVYPHCNDFVMRCQCQNFNRESKNFGQSEKVLKFLMLFTTLFNFVKGY